MKLVYYLTKVRLNEPAAREYVIAEIVRGAKPTPKKEKRGWFKVRGNIVIWIFIFLAFLAFFPFGCGRNDAKDTGPCFCNWRDYSGNPLIEPPTSEGIIADPTFLTPETTPDGKWHLFAHSLQGIFHFLSADGLD